VVFYDSTKHTTVLVVPIEVMFAIQRSELYSRHLSQVLSTSIAGSL
jgi:hypothetical protein